MDHIQASIEAANKRISMQFKDVAQYVEYDVYALTEALKNQRDEMIDDGKQTLSSFQAVVAAIQDRRNNVPSHVEKARLDVNELKKCDEASRALYQLQCAGLKTIKLRLDENRNFYDQILKIRDGHGYEFELPAEVKEKLAPTVAELRMAPKQS